MAKALAGFQYLNTLRTQLKDHHDVEPGILHKAKNAGAYLGCRTVAVVSLFTNVVSGAIAALATAILFPFSYITACESTYASAKKRCVGSFKQEVQSLSTLTPDFVKNLYNKVFKKDEPVITANDLDHGSLSDV